MEFGGRDVELGHLGVGDLDRFFVGVRSFNGFRSNASLTTDV
jgi:hypothetical protein